MGCDRSTRFLKSGTPAAFICICVVATSQTLCYCRLVYWPPACPFPGFRSIYLWFGFHIDSCPMSYLLIDPMFGYGAIVFDSRLDCPGGHWTILVEKSLSEYPHLRAFWSRTWPLLVVFAVQASMLHTHWLLQKPMSALQLRADLGQSDCQLQLEGWLCLRLEPQGRGTDKENTLKCILRLFGLPLKYCYLLTSVPSLQLPNNPNLPVGSLEKDQVSTI